MIKQILEGIIMNTQTTNVANHKNLVAALNALKWSPTEKFTFRKGLKGGVDQTVEGKAINQKHVVIVEAKATGVNREADPVAFIQAVKETAGIPIVAHVGDNIALGAVKIGKVRKAGATVHVNRDANNMFMKPDHVEADYFGEQHQFMVKGGKVWKRTTRWVATEEDFNAYKNGDVLTGPTA